MGVEFSEKFLSFLLRNFSAMQHTLATRTSASAGDDAGDGAGCCSFPKREVPGPLGPLAVGFLFPVVVWGGLWCVRPWDLGRYPGYSWGTGGVRVGYDLPRISPSGVRVGYGWGTVGVQVGYAGKFSVNRL